MSLLEKNFSDLINKPRVTVEALTGSYSHSVRLRRRDDVDLVLTTAARYDQDHAVITVAARLCAAVLRDESVGRGLLERVLPEVFPWVRFLPAGDAADFLIELVETLRAADDLDNLAPVAQLIAEWQHTAEVHADPELAAALRQDAEDLGPVPMPTIVR
jgi:hypothetical protein